jgi:hypothetical protein
MVGVGGQRVRSPDDGGDSDKGLAGFVTLFANLQLSRYVLTDYVAVKDFDYDDFLPAWR